MPLTNHDSRAMVFRHNERQVTEQARARNGVDPVKRAELLEGIKNATVDLGPITEHEPLDPALRPNVQPQMNGHKTNGWNPH